MQTNAPATSEWVDQFNRAVQFGQVNIDQAITVPAHASTHGVGGSDPVSAASIGAAAVTHASTHAVGGSDPVSAASIGAAPFNFPGARILACWSNVELAASASQYSVLGTAPKDIYGNNFVTPANSRSVIDGLFAVVRSFTGTASTNPQVRPYVAGTTIDSGNQGTTSLQLSGTLQLGGTTPVGGIFIGTNVLPSPGKAFAAASSSPQLILTTVGTGFSTYKADIFASFVVLPAAV